MGFSMIKSMETEPSASFGQSDWLNGESLRLQAHFSKSFDVSDDAIIPVAAESRSYGDKVRHSEALEIILSESGSYFDPDVVDAFVQSEIQFDEMSQVLRDPADITKELEVRQYSSGVAG